MAAESKFVGASLFLVVETNRMNLLLIYSRWLNCPDFLPLCPSLGLYKTVGQIWVVGNTEGGACLNMGKSKEGIGAEQHPPPLDLLPW